MEAHFQGLLNPRTSDLKFCIPNKNVNLKLTKGTIIVKQIYAKVLNIPDSIVHFGKKISKYTSRTQSQSLPKIW